MHLVYSTAPADWDGWMDGWMFLLLWQINYSGPHSMPNTIYTYIYDMYSLKTNSLSVAKFRSAKLT